MTNLLDTFKSHLGPELIARAVEILGETEGGVAKASLGLAPTILAGIAGKVSNPEVFEKIFAALKDFNPDILNKPESLLGGGNLAQGDPKDRAGHLLSMLLGAKIPALTNAISSFAGIRPASTSALLGLVGPMLMAVLNNKIKSDGLNATGLSKLLLGEKSAYLGALPAGIGSVLGLAEMGGSLGGYTTGDDKVAARGLKWFWPLLLVLGLGAAVMYYLKNEKKQPPVEAPAIETPVAPPAPKALVDLPPGSVEAALQAFILSTDSIDKNKWFDFPEIVFDVNKASLKPESENKLNAVLSILEAYPAVGLKIGGYTDSDGDDQKNMQLSDERAKACMAWLVSKGVAAERLSAEGYGETNPVAPNDTPENKAKNRRISLSVRAK